MLFDEDEAADSVEEEDEMVEIVEWVALVIVGVNWGKEDKTLAVVALEMLLGLLLILLLLSLLLLLILLVSGGGGARSEGKG